MSSSSFSKSSYPAILLPTVIDKMTLQVLFEFDKATLTEADLKELQKAIPFVKKTLDAKIRLDGYTRTPGLHKTPSFLLEISTRYLELEQSARSGKLCFL
jgi:outer membrane protein OmpA-like peptidoglycan-associated protein